MGFARAAIERACIHPDCGSTSVIPNSSAFSILFACASQENHLRE
jgi:hypothetical protein